MSKQLRIVFMGTPEFAVASLDKLCMSSHELVGVVTVADKAAGRGQQISMSAVKKYAGEKGLKVLQPEKLRDEHFLSELKELNADLFVVVAFRMLPEVVWTMPPLGTINLHGSLLPMYRGAAPINHAVMNGEKETGVTTFFLQHEIDTGKVIRRTVIPIGADETAGELHDKMMQIGADTLLETVNLIASGDAQARSQEEMLKPGEDVKTAPKIFKEDCEIDWEKPVEEVYNFIRGLSPYPAAWTTFGDKTLKIFSGEKIRHSSKPPEAYQTDGKNFLRIRCADGYISLKDIQIEGKKRMSVEDFLRGWRST